MRVEGHLARKSTSYDYCVQVQIQRVSHEKAMTVTLDCLRLHFRENSLHVLIEDACVVCKFRVCQISFNERFGDLEIHHEITNFHRTVA